LHLERNEYTFLTGDGPLPYSGVGEVTENPFFRTTRD